MGAGKGRASIYLSNQTGCNAKGIEYDERMYEKAQENLSSLSMQANAEFALLGADKYNVEKEDTVFFFFNPFSEKILETVVSNIGKSYCENPRDMLLLFYYPSLEYVGRLMTKDYLEFVDELDCSHLYKDNKGRECVMIFRVI